MANLHKTTEMTAAHLAVMAYIRAERCGGNSSEAAGQIDRALAQADAKLAALEAVAAAAREVLSNCYPHHAVDRDWDVLSHAAQRPLEHALAALDALEVNDG